MDKRVCVVGAGYWGKNLISKPLVADETVVIEFELSNYSDWDILIKGEKIIGLVHPHTLQVDAVKIIDASGKIVVPGGIEPHAHIGGPRQPERSGAAPVSLAAIYGGTTTVLDFATQIPGYDIKHALDEANDRWDGNAFTDFSYHPIFTKGASAEHIDQIPELIQDGFPSFKIFTTSIRPPSPQMQDNKTDFGRLAVIMKKLSTHAGILLVHSEDDEMVHYNYSRAKSNDLWDWWNMHRIHTNISEEVSFNRVINLAERLKCSIYFVHVSAKEGIQVIDQARLRGLPIYGETLHNYACFNSNNYKEEHGMKYHTYPSLTLGRADRWKVINYSYRSRFYNLGGKNQIQNGSRRDRRA